MCLSRWKGSESMRSRSCRSNDMKSWTGSRNSCLRLSLVGIRTTLSGRGTSVWLEKSKRELSRRSPGFQRRPRGATFGHEPVPTRGVPEITASRLPEGVLTAKRELLQPRPSSAPSLLERNRNKLIRCQYTLIGAAFVPHLTGCWST